MKVFEFNPETGRRGEQIGNSKRINWTGCGIDYLANNGYVEKINYRKPSDTATEEWTCHEDAGKTIVGKNGLEDVSYLSDKWICFCSGKYEVGHGKEVWEWVILPPKDLIKYKDVRTA